MSEPGNVVVVGSGVAGLSCALDLAAASWRVTVVTPGRAGHDGASARVHRLSPWILLTAPCVRGDSPRRFSADLERRSEGLARPELTRVLADGAHDTADELVEVLELRVVDGAPVSLPGDAVARGRRVLPRTGGSLLGPLVEACRGAGVELLESTLAVGLAQSADSVGGVGVVDPSLSEPRLLRASAVVLACGGTAGVFAFSTAPRWCAGSAIALASAASGALHHPELVQWLPATVRPRGAFLGSRLLLESRAFAGERELSRGDDLESMTAAMREASGQGAAVELELPARPPGTWPREVWLRDRLPWGQRVPLRLAAHHGIGGVAIDAWGRTSLPGLYACGEAAGGVQGRRRTMGSGLIEARLFGRRVARAIRHDAPRLGPGPGALVMPGRRPLGREVALQRRLDRLLGGFPGELTHGGAWDELRRWPEASEPRCSLSAWRAALRRDAALVLASLAARAGRKPTTRC